MPIAKLKVEDLDTYIDVEISTLAAIQPVVGQIVPAMLDGQVIFCAISAIPLQSPIIVTPCIPGQQ